MLPYTGNQLSKFRILLKNLLELCGDDCKECYCSINYAFSCTNAGLEVFPDWRCTSIEEVEQFIAEKAREGQSAQIRLELGRLGREGIGNRGVVQLGGFKQHVEIVGFGKLPRSRLFEK